MTARLVVAAAVMAIASTGVGDARATEPVGATPARQVKAPAIVLTTSPASPMAGERVVVAGRLAKKGKRKVVLQVRAGRGWHPAQSRRTTKAGKVRFALAAPSRTFKVRLVSPPGRGQRALRSRPHVLEVIGQRSTLSAAGTVVIGARLPVRITSVPARPGRPVLLEEKTRTGWVRAGRAAQDEAGTTTFQLAGSQVEGVRSLRAHLPRWRGAAAATSPTHDVLVKRAPASPEVRRLRAEVVQGSKTEVLVDASAEDPRTFTLESGLIPPSRVTLSPSEVGVTVVASMDAVPGTHSIGFTGRLCDAADVCSPVTATLDLTIRSLAEVATSGSPESVFTSPSTDRVADATVDPDNGTSRLSDELLLMMDDTSQARGTGEQLARQAAAARGAVVTGAYVEDGVYELRWPNGVDIATESAALATAPGVAAVAPSYLGSVGTDAVDVEPREWGTSTGRSYGWHLRAANVPAAWRITTGGTGLGIGVVDTGLTYANHDLTSTRLTRAGKANTVSEHAMHVSGIACATEDASGIVGASWGCPVYNATFDAADAAGTAIWKDVYGAAKKIVDETNVPIINMSLGVNVGAVSGRNCATAADNDKILDIRIKTAPMFRPLITSGRGADVLWTLSAGNNCAESPSSPMGLFSDRDNVITVASTNEDGKLSSFSNFGPGVEVAAPGGVNNAGVGVLSLGVPSSTKKEFCQTDLQQVCYVRESGTSMAAPLVAGIADLVRSASPELTADEIGRCIVASATRPVNAVSSSPAPWSASSSMQYSPGSLGVVDAEAAVTCGQSLATAPSDWTSVSAGGAHSCGLRSGQLWCWGANAAGRLGLGDTVAHAEPARVGPYTDWTAVAAGDAHTCGIRGGTLWCWGDNAYGQLGTGDLASRSVPTRVGAASDWTSVSAGLHHTCGVRAGGQAWCWGANYFAQLGQGDTTARSTPTRVGSATGWTSMTAGSYQTCGLRGGQLWCWGQHPAEPAGDPTNRDASPARVGSGSDWTSVSADLHHVCGLRGGGQLWCWGNNPDGRVGVGDTADRLAPARVGSASDWTRVSADGGSTCGVRAGGQLWCWGGNSYGQLGVGDTTNRLSPSRVGSGSGWSTPSVGSLHACAVRSNGQLRCWGFGGEGRLGVGDTADHAVPTPVD